MDNRLVIGEITRPQGVRGELKVTPLTDNPSRFLDLKNIYIDSVKYEVKKARVNDGYAYIYIEGINDRNTAENFRNKQILVDRKDAVKLEEGRYFIVDIIGCEVYVEDELIGTITDVLQYGSADVYVINSLKDGELMVPAIKKLLLSVDVENKKIICDKKTFGEVCVYED